MSLLGDRLRELRGALSLLDVERESGIPRFSISRYESGENVPSPVKLKQLATFYEVPYAELRKLYYTELFQSGSEEREALILCVLENVQRADLMARVQELR